MIGAYLAEFCRTARLLAEGEEYPQRIEGMADVLCSALLGGNKILLAGNGGSAADCQHLAGELVVRFRRDRKGLPAIALTVDTSVLTACLNDFGPDWVFSRQVEALGRPGDILWAISTSGNSPNILAACRAARKLSLRVLGFTGCAGGQLAPLADIAFRAPSDATSHAQECHIAVGHLLCLLIEKRIFGEESPA